jgi:hypothetical protein
MVVTVGAVLVTEENGGVSLHSLQYGMLEHTSPQTQRHLCGNISCISCTRTPIPQALVSVELRHNAQGRPGPDHFLRLLQRMCFLFLVTFGTVKPLATWEGVFGELLVEVVGIHYAYSKQSE